MVQHEGVREFASKGICLAAFIFPPVTSFVVESQQRHCWSFNAIGEFSRINCDRLLFQIFLNRRDPEEDYEEDKKKTIEEKVNYYGLDRSHAGTPKANPDCLSDN